MFMSNKKQAAPSAASNFLLVDRYLIELNHLPFPGNKTHRKQKKLKIQEQ
jgi:hypothetical protein